MSVEDCIGQEQGRLTGLPQPARNPVEDEIALLADVEGILAERGAQYGPPSDHHARTAAAVNAVIGTDLEPRDVALFFVIDKLVRSRTSPAKIDHYHDAVGYLAIAWGHQVRSG